MASIPSTATPISARPGRSIVRTSGITSLIGLLPTGIADVGLATSCAPIGRRQSPARSGAGFRGRARNRCRASAAKRIGPRPALRRILPVERDRPVQSVEVPQRLDRMEHELEIGVAILARQRSLDQLGAFLEQAPFARDPVDFVEIDEAVGLRARQLRLAARGGAGCSL